MEKYIIKYISYFMNIMIIRYTYIYIYYNIYVLVQDEYIILHQF